MIILFVILLCILIFLYWKYVKYIRCGNMICITGAIKTGKSLLGVRQAYQLYNKQMRKAILWNFLFRFLAYPFYMWRTRFKLKRKKPYPVLYSNIPLYKVPYVPVTSELLLRKVKPVEGSVCYICEASLVADSMSFKDPIVNEQLLLFNKLWGHASKGGYLIYDTQCISDNHYAIKRCLNSYFYIHHGMKGLFFHWLWIVEERFSDDKSTVNAYTEDVETKLKLHLVPKSTYRLYDRYCYSCLTDDLNASKEKVRTKDLKAHQIVSFKKYRTLESEGDKK